MTITVLMYQNITFTMMWDLLLCFSWAIYAPEKKSHSMTCTAGCFWEGKWAITMEQSLL